MMVEQSASDWKKDSLSFDSVAGLYDQYRPDYPEELVDHAIELTGLLEGGRILEVGSGTGKATLMFARRGYAIHCIEPGGNLASVAAQNLQAYPLVTFEITRFEEGQEHSAEFDLVMSAQAFHWIPKECGYAKAARALKPGGSLALFWNLSHGFHEQIAEDLDRIYLEIAPGLDNPLAASEAVIQKRAGDITQSSFFGPVSVQCFPWSQTYQTLEYLGLLNTYSDHLRLLDKVRQRLFDAIAAAIDAQGGSVERNYLAVLYVAPKLS